MIYKTDQAENKWKDNKNRIRRDKEMERETIYIIREIYSHSHIYIYMADMLNEELNFRKRLNSQMLNNYRHLVMFYVLLTF
jgi:hypothetical protein